MAKYEQRTKEHNQDLVYLSKLAMPATANQLVEAASKDYDNLVRPLRDAIEGYLSSLEGQSFDSEGDAEKFCTELRTLVYSRLGLALECGRPDCKEPAYLRFKKYGSQKKRFVFSHIGSRSDTNHHASTSVPKLKIKWLVDENT